MPKGVEHLAMLLITIVNYLLVIWSLMPKGVEHWNEWGGINTQAMWFDLWCRKALSTYRRIHWSLRWYCDLIFDAERRWAQSSVSKNSITYDGWFDLWCRKALSTSYRPGMEILIRGDLIFDAERRWALYSKDFGWIAYPVIWSLMPKGVEHIKSQLLLYYRPCDLIFDAERRWALWSRSNPIFRPRWFDLWCRKALSTSYLTLFADFNLSGDLIFDAERRWALQCSIVPPICH